MTKKLETAVYFGSGPVAAESLRRLLSDFQFEAIITKPSTVSDMKLIAPNVPVYSVEKKTELDSLIKERSFNSTLGILIDFGVIISQQTINHFSSGILNSHFSLLPQWRGPDPITFAILSGQTETGVSIMVLTEGMDEGPIVSFGEQQIDQHETTSSLTEKLITLSDKLLKESVPRYLHEHTAIPQEQAAELIGLDPIPTYSRKLSKADGKIIWSKSAEVIEREIRAYHHWPKSFTTLGSYEVIIKTAEVVQESGVPGEYRCTKKELVVYCGENALRILSLQPAGKKEMPIQAFLAGYNL